MLVVWMNEQIEDIEERVEDVGENSVEQRSDQLELSATNRRKVEKLTLLRRRSLERAVSRLGGSK